MLESSFGLAFFLKSPHKGSKIRAVYLRITVDGVPKETSTKRKWDSTRWDQKTERAIGTKEDARSLNFFLDSLILKVNEYKTEIMYSGKPITSEKVMDYLLGKTTPRIKVLSEFQNHNDEMTALLGKGYAKGTLDRFTITKNHLTAFIKFKFNNTDLEFKDLNLEFIKDFEFYLRTVRDCSNNTTLKYIANFKKIVIRAIDKEIIQKDPFKNFKGRKTKLVKKPLTTQELYELERHYIQQADLMLFEMYLCSNVTPAWLILTLIN